MKTAEMPAIIGSPAIDSPPLLDWGRDVEYGGPDMTEKTANGLADLHGSFADCDIAFSTAGNYHMALRELWYDLYLPKYAAGLNLRNWFFTTSPPVCVAQAKSRNIVFGNLSLQCMPQLAVAPHKTVSDIKASGLAEGDEIPVFRNRGNVLLVKKGNPEQIRSIWDLGRRNIRVVTPNPSAEPETFGNYSRSIYNIALNDGNAPEGWGANRLFNAVFNSRGGENKWLSGEKIHHREIPWSIAYGRADAGIIFYHLALDAVRRFPELFEIVPLGGTIERPQPLPGNPVGVHFAIRIRGAWSDRQISARELLIEAINSGEFTGILEKHGLKR